MKGPIKIMDFNDFIDPETLFDNIKSKKIRFEVLKKYFQLKLSSIRMGGNKSNKQLSEIENITNF